MEIKVNTEKFNGDTYKVDREASKQITGFASLDRPWMKYYNEITNPISVEMNSYEYFIEITKPYKNLPMIIYMNKVYKREDILKEVDTLRQKFQSMGVTKGDKISFIMLNTPEVFFAWLALTSLGATANLIKFDESSEKVKQIIDDTKSKYLFVTEAAVILNNSLRQIHECDSLKEIISIPIFSLTSKLHELKKIIKDNNRSDIKEKILKLLNENETIKTLKKQYHITSYNTWKNKKYHNQIIETTGSPEDLSLIVYTGGTTGTTKGVSLTNKNLNSSAQGFIYGEYGFDAGKKSMNVLPPSIAYYFNATFCLMCCGVSVDMIPFFTPESYPNLIKEHQPNIFLAGPILFKMMMQSPELQDLSFVTSPISGGDKLPVAEEIAFTNYLQEHGSSAITHQGYGESECTAAATYLKRNAAKTGSIGIPFINVDVAIFDYDTHQELPYGKQMIGEICISGDTVMKGYYNNPEATNKVLYRHHDGRLWLHTDDFGYMDSDGLIYHCGRSKRMLTRSGSKVWLNAIEDIICRHPLVLDCCCVKMADETEREVPVCHIVFKELTNYSQIIEEIDSMITKNLPAVNVPKYYIIKESLPYTEVNKKKDFNTMENENIFANYPNSSSKILIKKLPK